MGQLSRVPSSLLVPLLVAALTGCPPPAADDDAAAAGRDARASDSGTLDSIGTDRDAGAPRDAAADQDAGHGDTGRAAWVTIARGSFVMGSPTAEVGRESDETPHRVTLTRSFVMASAEVTQGEFLAALGYNPSHFADCGSACPVEMVTWSEAAAYCNHLSQRAGLPACYQCSGVAQAVLCTPSAAYGSPYDCPGYRLPTEAEWEYAARAGTGEATYNGDLDPQQRFCEQPNTTLDAIAWFCGNGGATSHPVAGLRPNGWGLYDMLGNVWEWCHDGFAPYPDGELVDPVQPPGDYCVLRGGAFNHGAGFSRAAYRYNDAPRSRRITMGFRPVQSQLASEDAG